MLIETGVEMDLFIKNAGTIIRDAMRIENNKDIWIKGCRIKKIGVNLPVPEGCKVIDATHKVLMPGLINAHTHLYQTMLRGIRDDLELQPWCESILFPFANLVHQYHWKDNDISAGYVWSALGSIEMIRSGVTSCINMDLTLDSVFEAWRDIGFRGIGAVTAVNRWIPKELDRPIEVRKDEILNFVDKWHLKEDGLLKVFMAPSTVFACTTDFLEWLVQQAENFDLGIQTHVSETKWEVEQSLKDVDKTPLDYLDSIGFLRRSISAAHCIHLTNSEIDLALKREVTPVYNPKSNMKLGSGIAPIVEMLKRGLKPAIATDGAASNDQLDMLEEMRTGLLLQKAACGDPGLIGAEDIFRMATENGARAAEIDAGTIDEGKLADMVILDLNQVNTSPVHNIIQNIVYCAKSGNVETSIINGKIVMEEGTISGVDESAIIHQAGIVSKTKFGSLDFNSVMKASS
jgi:5-methylthioadenosine/S-adenosylhomocysteine deaminase